MATPPAPRIRNLQHTTLDELNLSDAELAEFRRAQAKVVAVILADPAPSDDAFDQ